mmetsp:Transcript_30629/g.51588  ORF Transcript_30629/g.51588 Transcript_30629/m.51588 type:complete len:342 (+) Transcript_30629:95-1120(+)
MEKQAATSRPTLTKVAIIARIAMAEKAEKAEKAKQAALLKKNLVREGNPAALATASRLLAEAQGRLKLSTIQRQFASFKKDFKRELRADWHDGYDEQTDVFNGFVGDTVLPVIDACKVLVLEQDREHLLAHTALSWLESNLEGFRSTLLHCRVNVYEAASPMLEHEGCAREDVVDYIWWCWRRVIHSMMRCASLPKPEVVQCLKEAINQDSKHRLDGDSYDEDCGEDEEVCSLTDITDYIMEIKPSVELFADVETSEKVGAKRKADQAVVDDLGNIRRDSGNIRSDSGNIEKDWSQLVRDGTLGKRKTVADLKQYCTAHKLTKTGKKEILVERVATHVRTQ